MRRLLAIFEMGGYPNLLPLYRSMGYQVDVVTSQRRALSYLKKTVPDIIVAEFIFQSDFRDRTSNLETLMAVLQRHPQVKLVVFYFPEHADKVARLESRFSIASAIAFPVDEEKVRTVLLSLADA